jgi:hypothetical protein
MVRRDTGRGVASSFAWGTANGSRAPSAEASTAASEVEEGKGKKKGNKGKKQVLMNWG